MRAARRTRKTLHFEQLEPRHLLSAASLASLIGATWFGDFATAGEAAHAGAASLSASGVGTSTSSASSAAGANQNDWIVQFNTAAMTGMTSAAQCSRLLSTSSGVQFQIIEGLGREGDVLVRSSGAGATVVAGLLRADVNIASYELDSYQQFEEVPNDPSFSQQWSLANTGQNGGTPGDAINAEAAWNISTGSHNVVVAVIDTGVDYANPDLAANIWTNPLDTAANGYDGDGFAGDIHGYNFVADNGNVMDDNGHGTHVAGIIGASGNNGTGVTGINWSVSIMALKFLDASGAGYTSDAIRAINYMTMLRDDGINVVVANCSWGGAAADPALQSAMAAAGQAGILFVVAAGNNGTDNDTTPQYPANYEASLSNVITVAATDNNDHLASFSSYGVNTVDLGAPGVNILSTYNGGYAYLSGTSMATPEVAGVAALAWAVDPNATVAQIKDAILQGVDPVASLQGKVLTGGRLDAYNTLRLIEQDVTPPPAPPAPTPTPVIATLAASPGTVPSGATVTLTAQGVAESGGAVSSVSFYRDSDGNAQWDSSDQLIGTITTVSGGQAAITLSTAGLAPGTYQFFARAEDSGGNWSSPVATTLTVTAVVPPGSNAATAVPVTVGSTTGGTLATTGAVEWYKFQAVAGTCYIFQTGLLTLPDSVLTLYGTDGRTVLASNDDIAPGNYASRILWQAPAAGTYYLAVSSYANDYSGSFTLEVAQKLGPPALAAINNQTLTLGGTLSLVLSGSSPNGLPLTYQTSVQPRTSTPGMITAGVSGNVLTLSSSTARAGSTFQVQVTVSDGLQTTTRIFIVTLSTPAPAKPSTSSPLGRSLLGR
ncbi:MAG: S8 family serine peptidase [Thermoguttaceae bacterium]